MRWRKGDRCVIVDILPTSAFYSERERFIGRSAIIKYAVIEDVFRNKGYPGYYGCSVIFEDTGASFCFHGAALSKTEPDWSV